MNYTIRAMKETEYPLLEDFLYEAIFVPEGVEPPPKSIVNAPELQVYISGFGSEPHDIALIAERDNKAVALFGFVSWMITGISTMKRPHLRFPYIENIAAWESGQK